jgi:hypothetical protein
MKIQGSPANKIPGSGSFRILQRLHLGIRMKRQRKPVKETDLGFQL